MQRIPALLPKSGSSRRERDGMAQTEHDKQEQWQRALHRKIHLQYSHAKLAAIAVGLACHIGDRTKRMHRWPFSRIMGSSRLILLTNPMSREDGSRSRR
jgi:hypothetical protein